MTYNLDIFYTSICPDPESLPFPSFQPPSPTTTGCNSAANPTIIINENYTHVYSFFKIMLIYL